MWWDNEEVCSGKLVFILLLDWLKNKYGLDFFSLTLSVVLRATDTEIGPQMDWWRCVDFMRKKQKSGPFAQFAIFSSLWKDF